MRRPFSMCGRKKRTTLPRDPLPAPLKEAALLRQGHVDQYTCTQPVALKSLAITRSYEPLFLWFNQCCGTRSPCVTLHFCASMGFLTFGQKQGEWLSEFVKYDEIRRP
ncbi:hypothetical protein GGR93_001578 [Sulfitobacter noctilucicola]|uniref:Uncharacterized protein n=1 Tax=Sulfitobacter noctilucicola TaxID=1342301 RepID=A0A7W6M7E1_9RHOB|nr:hypothetical protein [Sulfitobacter noctilucicola]